MHRETSKFISLILRHKPETIGITLDEHGWANVSELIEGIKRTHPFDMTMLEEIVRTDEKKRYSFNEDKTMIRANQGHSVSVDVEPECAAPPEFLWHGTGLKYTESIDKEGLFPKSRLYVHLSKEYGTAIHVGGRHGLPVVYKVLAGQMTRDGYMFYVSANGVWLTKEVPVKYLKKVDVQIVRATIEDACTIAELAIKMWKEHTIEGLAGDFEKIIRKGESAVFLLLVDGHAIGFAQCQLRHDYVEGTESSPVGYLEGIFVEEQYRHMGYAKELLSRCEEWAREQGCMEFASDCELTNDTSLAFHLKMGFAEANRIICFTKRL